MPELWNRILEHLDQNCGTVNTLQLSDLLNTDHQEIVGVVKSLECLGEVVEVKQNSYLKTELTEEGKSFLKYGSHEWNLLGLVPPGEDGISKSELMKVAGSTRGKIGLSKALQNEWVKVMKMGGGVKNVVRLVEAERIEDKVRSELEKIAEGNSSVADADLRKRKLLVKIQTNNFSLNRGKNFSVDVVKPETELTPEMLSSGDWKHIKFKQYNFESLGASLNSGHLHPLLKVRTEFRSILLQMGFSEMGTNSFVESSFWNFDALFVPQKHPARDVQDTFFMSQPQECNSTPKELMEKVKSAHVGKDFDSLGYGRDCWKVEESYRNCMRTHTTSISARMLHEIGCSQKHFKPAKLFSIDRVFRNETLDGTHLAEFYQVEGLVADYNLSLGNLIGILKEFFSRLGMGRRLRFKPAYNPYTEPSMEVFSYHDGLQKWIEVGNSGMFRPEVLLPLGLPMYVRVIAWGLSLERPTMIRYGIKNIRDLVGHKVDLRMVYDHPICRLDKSKIMV